MNPSEYEILTLLPQRPPFILIDKMVMCDVKETVTEFTVTEDCLLSDEGVLQPWGMMENIAQTCAARIGYLSLAKGGEVKLGVIGAVTDMKIEAMARTGERIETRIKVEEEVLNLTLISAEIRRGEETLATAKMKIALLN
ncbi:MAG: pseudouridylate synthase [Bacteroidales bacterium]|nr:pseudouridylate synthase [Bacteroidales bacterium]